MPFSQLYDAVQDLGDVKISTRWLRDKAIEYSEINHVKEQWSSILDITVIRGFYIEGPMGPPIPLKANEALITLARAMCIGHVGEHWRRFIYTKELMHVFDEDDEKTDTQGKFDTQIEKFGDPSIPTSPQFRAESKAYWRALAVLCPERRRLEYKAALAENTTSVEVVAAALRIPPAYIHDLVRDDFPTIIAKIK